MELEITRLFEDSFVELCRKYTYLVSQLNDIKEKNKKYDYCIINGQKIMQVKQETKDLALILKAEAERNPQDQAIQDAVKAHKERLASVYKDFTKFIDEATKGYVNDLSTMEGTNVTQENLTQAREQSDLGQYSSGSLASNAQSKAQFPATYLVTTDATTHYVTATSEQQLILQMNQIEQTTSHRIEGLFLLTQIPFTTKTTFAL